MTQTTAEDAKEQAAQAASTAKDQAAEVAGAATDEGQKVASVAQQEAAKVAEETKQQAKVLLDEARVQLVDQARMGQDHLTQTLSSLGSDLDRMAGQADGLASELVAQVAQQARGIAGRLEGKDPAELLGDVRAYARRKPGTFLLGALAAGVVAGRLARGLQASSPETTSSRRVPDQRTVGTEAPARETVATRTTPQAPAMASFPADRPGDLR